jgi:hypothetical protein
MELGGQSLDPTAVTLPKINRRFLEPELHSLIAVRTELSQNKHMNSLCQHSIELFKDYELGKGVEVDCCDVFKE